MRRPETRYVSVGRDRVAYKVFGEGERDVLYLLPPWLSVDALWENVGHLRIWRTAGEQFRCVMLDHRGFGMSDTIAESSLGDPVACVEDALAVLDAVGMERVCRDSTSKRDSPLSAARLEDRRIHRRRCGSVRQVRTDSEAALRCVHLVGLVRNDGRR